MAKKPVSISIRKPPPANDGLARASTFDEAVEEPKIRAKSKRAVASAVGGKTSRIAAILTDTFVRDLRGRMPVELAERLEKYCREHQRAAVDVVLEALRVHVAHDERRASHEAAPAIGLNDDEIAWNDVVHVVVAWLKNMTRTFGDLIPRRA